MKNKNIQTILIALLFVASFSSYVFLNTLSSPKCTLGEADMEKMEMVDLEGKEKVMPDVAIVKRVFEILKHQIPVSK